MSDTHPQVGETYEVTPDSLTRGATGVHQKVQILSGRFWGGWGPNNLRASAQLAVAHPCWSLTPATS